MTRAFRTREQFRQWLEKNHASEAELVVRCFKVHATHRGIGYREGLDEALCFGWIDGVRHGLDADSFTVRFTPRKARSNWSSVNIKRATELESEGRMHAAGLEAFRARDTSKRSPYSFEHAPRAFDSGLEKRFRANRKAWAFFEAQPPSYRKVTTFWVTEAKKPETRLRRLDELMKWCVAGKRIPSLTGRKSGQRLRPKR
ncbi:MAG TPA: YdeI/OmpD-associated family protein [Gemmatimonadaceae bacterium]|nr:YdeI/OmpD-associated family protein [Gemmatimonadaceae bacterium]